jgi:WD40 repeat protein
MSRSLFSGEGNDHPLRELSLTRPRPSKQPDHLYTSAFSLSPSGDRAALGWSDGLIEGWDCTSGRKWPDLKGHRYRVRDFCFLPDGRLLSADDHGEIWRWDTGTGAGELRVPALAEEGWRTVLAAFSPAGRHAVVEDLSDEYEDAIQVEAPLPEGAQRFSCWDLTEGRKLWEWKSPGRDWFGCGALAISPDGQVAALGGNNCQIFLLDMARGTLLRRFADQRTWRDPVHPDEGVGEEEERVVLIPARIGSLAFLPDGQHLVTGEPHRIVREWDLDAGRAERVLVDASRGMRNASGWAPTVTVLADGRLVSWTDDWGQIHLTEITSPWQMRMAALMAALFLALLVTLKLRARNLGGALLIVALAGVMGLLLYYLIQR